MNRLKLALDWTPNINHIGFFVAKEKGFYKEEDIELDIISPSDDNYQVTPAKKVELGQADFALCPMESILSYQTKDQPFDLKAIASIYTEDVSAIVCKSKPGISSPKDLDGKKYASYKARYEDEIVKQMIRNDGGKGEIEVVYPDKLGIWETVMNEKYDATWIFMNWEGVQTEAENVDITCFKMKDYDIPYSYSPVIATSEQQLKKHSDLFRKFIKATKLGFLFVKENPKEAASILSNHISESDKNIDLAKVIDYSVEHFGDVDSWGLMEKSNVDEYLEWIYSHNLEDMKRSSNDLFTNELFK